MGRLLSITVALAIGDEGIMSRAQEVGFAERVRDARGRTKESNTQSPVSPDRLMASTECWTRNPLRKNPGEPTRGGLGCGGLGGRFHWGWFSCYVFWQGDAVLSVRFGGAEAIG